MVGGSYTSANTPGFCCIQHAFRTAPNRPIDPTTDDLGTLGGSNNTAYAINNAGQVVGDSDNGRDTCPTPHGSSPPNVRFARPRTALSIPPRMNSARSRAVGALRRVSMALDRSWVWHKTRMDFHVPFGRPPTNPSIPPRTTSVRLEAVRTAWPIASTPLAKWSVIPGSPADDANHGFRTAANAPINPFDG